MTSFEHPALELLAKGQLTQAAAEARRALTERPDHPELAACLAEATADTNPTEARRVMERASSAKPDDAALLLAMARVQWRTGDHRAATLTTRRVTSLAPDWAEGQATSAVITLDQSRRGFRTSPAPDLYRRAKEASASAVASDPDWPTAHIVDGQVELADGNHDRAAAAARVALGLEPNNPPALVLLGDARLAAGDEPQADRTYEYALPWPPAVERLRVSAATGSWLRPNVLLVAMFVALFLSVIMRGNGQTMIGIVLSLLGIAAAGLIVVGAARRALQRRAAARQEVARLLTPGSELVGAGGNIAPSPAGE